MSNFVLESGPCHLQLIQVPTAAAAEWAASLTHTDYQQFAPSLGLAYQVSNKTVIRSGFGEHFTAATRTTGSPDGCTNNPPFVATATFVGDQTNPAFLLRTGFPANA